MYGKYPENNPAGIDQAKRSHMNLTYILFIIEALFVDTCAGDTLTNLLH